MKEGNRSSSSSNYGGVGGGSGAHPNSLGSGQSSAHQQQQDQQQARSQQYAQQQQQQQQHQGQIPPLPLHSASRQQQHQDTLQGDDIQHSNYPAVFAQPLPQDTFFRQSPQTFVADKYSQHYAQPDSQSSMTMLPYPAVPQAYIQQSHIPPTNARHLQQDSLEYFAAPTTQTGNLQTDPNSSRYYPEESIQQFGLEQPFDASYPQSGDLSLSRTRGQDYGPARVQHLPFPDSSQSLTPWFDPLAQQSAATTSHIKLDLAKQGRDMPSNASQTTSVSALASVPSTQRKRIAQSACEVCRRKRTKCVIEPGKSDCNVCRSLRIPCAFSGVDKRKESVRVLRERLTRLEALFDKVQYSDKQEAENIVNAIRRGERDSLPYSMKMSSSPSRTALNQSINESAPAPADVSNNVNVEQASDSGKGDARSASDEYSQDDEENLSMGGGSNPTKQSAGAESQRADSKGRYGNASARERPRSRGGEPQVEALAGLTDRLTITEDGTIRAVSAVSSLAFEPARDPANQRLPQGVDDIKSHAAGAVYDMAASVNAMLKRETDLPADLTSETVEHLLNLYFLWEAPQHPLISRPAFLQHMATGGIYFSPLLLNAILAFASVLSDRPDLRSDSDDPHSAGEDFFVLADDTLTAEIDGAVGPVRVPITTVQGLILLSARLYATGNELKAWMFMGTCSRMAMDLGLHLDASAFLTNEKRESPILSEDDLYVRSRTFWGVWFFEQEMSSVYGRPGILRDVVITCPSFETFDTEWSRAEDYDWWKSLEAGSIKPMEPISTSSVGISSLWPSARQIVNVFVHSMRLIYYRVANRSKDSQNDHQLALNKVMGKTRRALEMLPSVNLEEAEHKDLSPGPIPLLLYLHVMIQSHIILMNRPFMNTSTTSDETVPLPPATSGMAQDPPRSRCIKAAFRIIALLKFWREAFGTGLRTAGNGPAHILMSAATVFLNEMSCGIEGRQEQVSSGDIAMSSSETAFPPEFDIQQRMQFGRDRLNEDIIPLLAEMAQYRPSPGLQLKRLARAMTERDRLMTEQEQNRTSTQNPSSVGFPGGGAPEQLGQSNSQAEAASAHPQEMQSTTVSQQFNVEFDLPPPLSFDDHQNSMYSGPMSSLAFTGYASAWAPNADYTSYYPLSQMAATPSPTYEHGQPTPTEYTSRDLFADFADPDRR